LGSLAETDVWPSCRGTYQSFTQREKHAPTRLKGRGSTDRLDIVVSCTPSASCAHRAITLPSGTLKIVGSHSQHVVTAARTSLRLRIAATVAFRCTRGHPIDRRHVAHPCNMHTATMISVFRGGSRAACASSVRIRRSHQLSCFIAGQMKKKEKEKKEKESAGPLGLKRFFTSRWLELGSLY